jgi:hypothetical protein
MDSLLVRFRSIALALALAALAVAAPTASAGDAVDRAPNPDDRAADAGDRTANGEEAPEAGTPEVTEDKPAGGACEDRVFSRVFKPWHDRALYTLAPGGDFETQAEGWTLSGPATIAAESAPFLLGPALGLGSLELAAGATALSPQICVKRGFPTFRFVARSAGAEDSVLRVDVVYASGKVKRSGRVKPRAEWAPTRKLSLAQGRFKAKRRGTALVQLRFVATAGTVRMDDVYVDPRYNR